MAYPTVKFKGEKPELKVSQAPEAGKFVIVACRGNTHLACGTDDSDWFVIFPETGIPFSAEIHELTVIKDVDVEITVK